MRKLADEPAPVVDIWIAEKVVGSWREEERRLVAAGWKPKKQSGKIIRASPESRFWYSQEIAL